MTDPRDLRVSDAEREHVVSLLNKAVGRGMITLDEFTTRTDTALAAVTRADLNAVLLDLPGMVNTDAIAGPRIELKNAMGTTVRKGVWVVPPELLVRNTLGTTDLDFTQAVLPPAVTIDLDVSLGSVKLVVPEGSSVNIDAVDITAGEIKDKVRNAVGSPQFVLRGAVRGGSVLIKHKKKALFG
ncbi:hypothetical protein BBK82_14765 [Lentzea guizhouensis]|uniref:DUF1707 domain-containing protein n=1 Tax=Lentzea guizhouensis TaxID=1586287 RepID=A0A1B2HHE0_9PSEU|nr:DUF1707 domain-containing protein [Lentzea guizhouensis]ANZ37140.1 hypothetical protein BBK82_14765 [Lentzea guizhouensis]